jgi:preprotein translocase subunit SecE
MHRQRPGDGLPRRTYSPKKEPPAGLVLKLGRGTAQKVTWPTRKETTITTIMVFVMVAIASVFFLLADQLMRIAVSFILGI